MDKSKLRECIENINKMPNPLSFHETQTKTSIIEPICKCLGWDISNPNEVLTEYKTWANGRVDYAFLNKNKPLLLVEAKKAKESLGKHSDQLLRYAYEEGAPLALLTNGFKWWIYLPLAKGHWKERKLCSIDIEKQDIDSICDDFEKFLSKKNVISGDSIAEAKKAHRRNEVLKTVEEVCKAITDENPKDQLKFVITETKERCGYRLSEKDAEKVIAKYSKPIKKRISTLNSIKRTPSQETELEAIARMERERPNAMAISNKVEELINTFTAKYTRDESGLNTGQPEIRFSKDGDKNNFLVIALNKGVSVRLKIKQPEETGYEEELKKAEGIEISSDKSYNGKQRKVTLVMEGITKNPELLKNVLRDAYNV